MTSSFGSEALARWGVLDLVLREDRRDRLLASVPPPPPAVLAVLRSQWSEVHGETSDQWCERLGMQSSVFDAFVSRRWRWEAWCEQSFAGSVSSTFLSRKAGLDQVCFWQLDVDDADFAAELYLQLREGETAIHLHHAQLYGPVALEQLPAHQRNLLMVMRVGDISAPKPVGSTWRLVSLHQRLPAALDDAMRQRLLLELGEQHLASGR